MQTDRIQVNEYFCGRTYRKRCQTSPQFCFKIILILIITPGHDARRLQLVHPEGAAPHHMCCCATQFSKKSMKPAWQETFSLLIPWRWPSFFVGIPPRALSYSPFCVLHDARLFLIVSDRLSRHPRHSNHRDASVQ
jgi:hypothetical protein